VDEAVVLGRLLSKLVKQLTEVVQHLTSRVLKVVDLPDDAFPLGVVVLEVLHVDDHRREDLGYGVMKLAGKTPFDLALRATGQLVERMGLLTLTVLF
jgi:hypothetical protein